MSDEPADDPPKTYTVTVRIKDDETELKGVIAFELLDQAYVLYGNKNQIVSIPHDSYDLLSIWPDGD